MYCFLKKIAYTNTLKTTGRILMRFYTVIFLVGSMNACEGESTSVR